jgi:hypothetical protein
MGLSTPILGVDGDGDAPVARTYYKVGKLRDLELVESDALASCRIKGMSDAVWWSA